MKFWGSKPEFWDQNRNLGDQKRNFGIKREFWGSKNGILGSGIADSSPPPPARLFFGIIGTFPVFWGFFLFLRPGADPASRKFPIFSGIFGNYFFSREQQLRPADFPRISGIFIPKFLWSWDFLGKVFPSPGFLGEFRGK